MVEEIKADTVTKDYISDPEIKVYAEDKPLPEERGAYAHGSGGRRKPRQKVCGLIYWKRMT